LGAFQDHNSLSYSEPAGGYAWVTGEPWSYGNFAPGEPNNSCYGAPEDYLCLWSPNSSREALWNDLPNDPSVLPNQAGVQHWVVASYIVEAVPEPSGGLLTILGAALLVRRRARRLKEGVWAISMALRPEREKRNVA
jgi:hypothetical protein